MKLLGKLVYIVDAANECYGLGGIVRGFDGERYLVHFSNYGGRVFKSSQFVVNR